MSSEAKLFTFPTETESHLRSFRLGTSRSTDPQAVIYMIEKNENALVVKQDPKTEKVYKDLETLAEDLPDNSPRFVLLSYPLKLKDDRISVPYVLLYYLPVTCNAELRMLYASAKELMKNKAGVGRIIDMDSAEDLEDIPDKLRQ